MPDEKPTEHKPFVSNATIYKGGSGHPFPPGSEVTLHPDHIEDFRKAGMEKKPDTAQKSASLKT